MAGLLGRAGKRLMATQLPLTAFLLADILYCGVALTNFLGMVWLFCAQCEGPESSWLADVGELFVLLRSDVICAIQSADLRACHQPSRVQCVMHALLTVPNAWLQTGGEDLTHAPFVDQYFASVRTPCAIPCRWGTCSEQRLPVCHRNCIIMQLVTGPFRNGNHEHDWIR